MEQLKNYAHVIAEYEIIEPRELERYFLSLKKLPKIKKLFINQRLLTCVLCYMYSLYLVHVNALKFEFPLALVDEIFSHFEPF